MVRQPLLRALTARERDIGLPPTLQERAGSIPVLSAPPDHMRLGLQPSLAAQSRAPHIVEQLQRRDVEAQKMEDVSRMYGSAMAMRLKTERALCEQARAAQEPSLERAPLTRIVSRLSRNRRCNDCRGCRRLSWRSTP